MSYSFLITSAGQSRVSWLHYYSQGLYFFIPTFTPLVFVVSLYFEINIILSCAIVLMVLILDETRMSVIYYFIMFLLFYRGRINIKSIKILIVLLMSAMIALSFYRLYAKTSVEDFMVEFFKNLFSLFSDRLNRFYLRN